MKTVAGIDLGTQSMKIVIYDYAERKEVIKTSAKIDMIAENAGTREQKTQWYKDALKSCFERIPSEIRASIRALGVSGQQHGFIALDKNAEPVYNIKLWNDSTTLQECKALTKKLGGDEKVIEEAGNVIIPSFTAGKILWLKEHKKEAFDAMRYIMLPHDYVNFLLTGNYVMEYGDASGTLLLNAKKTYMVKKICDAIDPGLYEKLPPLISPDKAAGTVCKKASEEFGIPEGIVVSSGGGDNMMGAIGTGTVEEGILTMSMGTSGTLYGYSDNLVADPLNGISGFCSSTGGYLPLLCTMNCTVVTEYTRNLFGLNVKDFDEEAAKAVPGADGVFIMPYLNGERFPHLPHGKCSIEGLTAGNYKRENICRAALESAAFAMKGGIELFEKLGFKAKEIRLIGGGAKSAIWRQITADIMGFPIVMPLYDEAAALGAALQALYVLELSEGKKVSIASLCAEHVKINGTASTVPNPQNRKAYDARYDDYRTMLGCLSGLYK